MNESYSEWSEFLSDVDCAADDDLQAWHEDLIGDIDDLREDIRCANDEREQRGRSTDGYREMHATLRWMNRQENHARAVLGQRTRERRKARHKVNAQQNDTYRANRYQVFSAVAREMLSGALFDAIWTEVDRRCAQAELEAG